MIKKFIRYLYKRDIERISKQKLKESSIFLSVKPRVPPGVRKDLVRIDKQQETMQKIQDLDWQLERLKPAKIKEKKQKLLDRKEALELELERYRGPHSVL